MGFEDENSERIRLSRERDYEVMKGNELIRKTRYKLSLVEQKTVAYICSMIKPAKEGQPYQRDYQFDVKEYCQLCGIEYKSGKNYADIKETLKKLSDKSIWMELKKGSSTLVRWLSNVTIEEKSGIVNIKLDEYMIPFLFDLKDQFTSYQLREVLGMKSKYSIRLFEILKSYEYLEVKEFDIDYLRGLLLVDKKDSYSNFKDFRRYVLDVALKEINSLTYMTVTYEATHTRHNKVSKVKFRMKYADRDDPCGRIDAWNNQYELFKKKS